MGTSASVSGAGPGSPLIPDWVEDSNSNAIPFVDDRRLAGARRALGKFASSGDRDGMRRGIGHYVRHGRGGAGMAARRSAGTAIRAASLGGIVGDSAVFDEVRSRIRDALGGRPDAQELIAAIAAAAIRLDGTLDSEIGQQAASESLQFICGEYPDVDLFALNETQREALLERFLAIDCFGLFYTETGKHIQSKGNLLTIATKIDEIKSYFCETFRQANSERRDAGKESLGSMSDREIVAECRAIVNAAYVIFEAYLDED